MSKVIVGVIGGSGLYEMEGLEKIRRKTVKTPYGSPSDSYLTGELKGVPMVFLPRHGRGHRILPSEVNYRANIYGMKKLGVTHIISVSACGSLKEEIKPGHIVMIDQFFDRTKGRIATFFGNGVVAHVPFADPIENDLRKILLKSGKELGIKVHDGGCYVCMEGPQFSTRTESHFYRSVGATMIGMTNLTEAKLAREAAISYATIALATDYDCWRTENANVDVKDIMAVMAMNIANARKIVAAAVPKITQKTGAWIKESLRYCIVTDKKLIKPERKKQLEIIVKDYTTL
jgi:5'-methylthioadenosine phosphorylase